MSVARYYTIDSGLVTIGSLSATPMLYISSPSTADSNILRVKADVVAVSSPAPPSNGSIFAQVCKVTGTKGGGASVTPVLTSQATLASQLTYSSGSTALTGLTQGVELWADDVPFAAGAEFEDAYENTGLEIWLKESGQYAVYFTAASGFGSGMAMRCILSTSE